MTTVPTVTSTSNSSDAELKVILHESDAIQAGINRTYGAVYTTFGVVLPALVGIFAFAAKDLHLTGDTIPKVALAFVIVFALSGLWAHSVWMELLRYVRYKFVVLMPRLYNAVGRSTDDNYLQWSGRRSSRNGMSILVFNLGCWLVLLVVHIAFIGSAASALVQAVSLVFIAAVTASNIAVMREAADVEMAIESSKHQNNVASDEIVAA